MDNVYVETLRMAAMAVVIMIVIGLGTTLAYFAGNRQSASSESKPLDDAESRNAVQGGPPR